MCEIPTFDPNTEASDAAVWVTPVCVNGVYMLHQGTPRRYPLEKRSGEEDFHVSCVAEGRPTPTVTWKKNGHSITAADSGMYQGSHW